jgi:RNA polymerase sigma-70 factor, ECF subfamily
MTDDERVAIAAAFSASAPGVARYLDVLVRDRTLAEDLVQEAGLLLLREPAPPRSVQGWLLRVARNLALNSLRAARRERARRTVVATRGPQAAARVPEDVLESAEDGERIRACLDRLPRAARELLWLRIVDGLSLRELAEVCGEPRTTAARRAEEALVRLARCFHGEPA